MQFAGAIAYCPCCENLWGNLGGLGSGQHDLECFACRPKEEIPFMGAGGRQLLNNLTANTENIQDFKWEDQGSLAE